ncbi:MAG: RDD family protein [Gemmatimonadetes bacterium]|nr:RDD family protein [Gemmatimonadota bacterium]MYF16359.1 RDD family protein [Gemmatimonadota bacterium]
MEQSRNEAFVESLQNYSLSELEDIYAHLDRDLFPERFDQVRAEIEARLKDFDPKSMDASTLTDPPGILRRLASSAIDFSMQVLVPFLIFFLLKSVLFPTAPTATAGGGRGGGRGGGGRGRGGGGGGGNQSDDLWSDITGFVGSAKDIAVGLIEGDPAAQSRAMIIWNDFGIILVILLVFRVFLTLSGWARSGFTPGMRELGIRVERVGGGIPTWSQAVGRFVLQPLLFIATLGFSGFWMLWDPDSRALHDKLLGTKLVRMVRTWEKTETERKFE